MALDIPEEKFTARLNDLIEKLQDEHSDESKGFIAIMDAFLGTSLNVTEEDGTIYSTDWEESLKKDAEVEYTDCWWDYHEAEDTEFYCMYCGGWLHDYCDTCSCLPGRYDN